MSYRRVRPGGVIQFAQGRSRSARSARSAEARADARVIRRSRIASRVASASSTLRPPGAAARDRPTARRSPRTTPGRRRPPVPGRNGVVDHRDARPTRRRRARSSRSRDRGRTGSTAPPGKTVIPGAKAISGTRRSTNTCRPEAESRSTITVLAGRTPTTLIDVGARSGGNGLNHAPTVNPAPHRARRSGASCGDGRRRWDITLAGAADDPPRRDAHRNREASDLRALAHLGPTARPPDRQRRISAPAGSPPPRPARRAAARRPRPRSGRAGRPRRTPRRADPTPR